MGRVFAIGDIHGCLTALQTLEKALVFGPDDKVITLGDYVDRGPDTKGVIDNLIELQSRTQLVTLRGNHEVMMLEAPARGLEYTLSWMNVGGEATMASYGAKNWIDVPDEHWQFLEKTLALYETETHFFVHANIVPNQPLTKQAANTVYWGRFIGNEKPHCSGKIMVCGHTAQRSGVPQNIGHAVCIDTWAYGEGWLTCLEVGSGQYWQANQKGELREATLEKP